MRSLLLLCLALCLELGIFGVGTARAASNPDAVAVIIGNKTYQDAPEIAFADRDAASMRRYVIDVLGYDEANVITVENAGYVRMIGLFGSRANPRGQLARRLGATPGGSDVFVYFSGHGFPGLADHKGYLLPVDAEAADAEDTGYPLELLTDNLAGLGARSVTLVLDACFSGDSAAGPLLKDKSVVVRPADPLRPRPRMTVLAASAPDEMANWDRPDRHGAFTEFFLRAVYGGADDSAYGGHRDGRITAAAVKRYLDREMSRWTARELDSEQIASLTGDPAMLLASFAPGHAPVRPDRKPEPLPAVLPVPAPVPGIPPNVPPAPAPNDDTAPPVLGGKAPIATFMRSNAGWTAIVSLPEPALELFYRFGRSGEFTSTGKSGNFDWTTGERAPALSFPMPTDGAATVVELRYRTPHGDAGPFAILFDPEAELFRENKKNLESLPGSWAEFSKNGPSLVYLTLLVSYRCAISDLRYGLDDAKPLAKFDLPSCDPKNPFAVPFGASTYLSVPAATRAINLQIIWRDGTQSRVIRIQR